MNTFDVYFVKTMSDVELLELLFSNSNESLHNLWSYLRRSATGVKVLERIKSLFTQAQARYVSEDISQFEKGEREKESLRYWLEAERSWRQELLEENKKLRSLLCKCRKEVL